MATYPPCPNPAPIALFVYNRPWHIQKTIEALQKNYLAPESDLYIFSDGAKDESTEQQVEEVRQFIQKVDVFRSVSICQRQTNLGLANNIIQGITQVVNDNQRIIVIEDDLITSPYFLSYMNHNLELYKDNTNVVSIHGYTYPLKQVLPEAFFIRGADCWGWATWKHGWDIFNVDGAVLLQQLESSGQLREFDFSGSYPYSTMLRDMIAGRNDSWAVRWYASAFLANKLTLYPGCSLVYNSGNDGSGTHSDDTATYNTQVTNQPIAVAPIVVEENLEVKSRMARFFRQSRNRSFMRKLLQLVVEFFKK